MWQNFVLRASLYERQVPSKDFETTSRIAIAKFYEVAVAIGTSIHHYKYRADSINAVACAILSLTFMLITSQVAIEASSSETSKCRIEMCIDMYTHYNN